MSPVQTPGEQSPTADHVPNSFGLGADVGPEHDSFDHASHHDGSAKVFEDKKWNPKRNIKTNRRILRKEIAESLMKELSDQDPTSEMVPPESDAARFALKLREEIKRRAAPGKTGREVAAKATFGLLHTHKTSEEEAVQRLLASVIYCDENVLALNKPPGLPSQDGAGTRYSVDSLSDRLLLELKRQGRIGRGVERAKIVHRIDQDASGVMVLGLNQRCTDTLNAMFKQRTVHKEYYAIAVGGPAARHEQLPFTGEVDIPLVEGTLPSGQFRMRCISKIRRGDDSPTDQSEERRVGRNGAITRYETLATGIDCCLLRLTLVTGRRHQARVHLAQGLGWPVLGDHKFWHLKQIKPQVLPTPLLSALGLTQQQARHLPLHLHARTLVLPDMHPGGQGRPLRLRARLPPFFTRNMRRLKLLL